MLQAELEAGGRWRFVTEDRRRLLASGEIALEPPARLELRFAAADLDDAPSRLAIGLEAIDGWTRVEVTHGAFGGETATFRRFRRAHPLALSAMGRSSACRGTRRLEQKIEPRESRSRAVASVRLL